MIGNLPYVAVAIFIGLGIYTLMFKKNLIKIAIGVVLIENGVNLFLITLGYRKGAIAPIYTQAPSGQAMVLPTPQAGLTNSSSLDSYQYSYRYRNYRPYIVDCHDDL